MAASQLGVYNKALRWLESRQLSSVNEPREPARLLNAEWQDAVQTCLYEGFWNFALRMVMATPDTAAIPNFGRKYSYTKPADWVRTFQVSPDDRFLIQDRNFIDQNNAWYSDLPYFYARYVSNDPNFGLNMALWTPGFVEFLAIYLADLIAPRIMQEAEKIDALSKRLKRTKISAMASDAMDQPPGKRTPDTWVTSRAPRGSVYPYGGGWDGEY